MNQTTTYDDKKAAGVGALVIPQVCPRVVPGSPAKICTKCGKLKQLNQYHRNPNTKDRLQYWCKECVQAYCRSPERLKIYAEYSRQNLTQNAKSREAKQIVRYAIRHGEMVCPHRCEECGCAGPVDGHHPDYSKPLKVEWLCRSCHLLLHRKLSSQTSN